MPDRKQKGRVLGGAENPEFRLLEAAKQAMQVGARVCSPRGGVRGVGREVQRAFAEKNWCWCMQCSSTAWGVMRASCSKPWLPNTCRAPPPPAAQPSGAGCSDEGGQERGRWVAYTFPAGRLPDACAFGGRLAGTYLSTALAVAVPCGIPWRPPHPSAAPEPEAHRLLDFWLLLVMMTLGPDRRRAAEALLRCVAETG